MTSAFDAYRTSYDAAVQDSIAFSGLRHDFFLEAKAAALAALFTRHFGAARPSLLDVGCGVGLLHRHLTPLVRALAGTDPSREAIGRARSENRGVDYRAQADGVLPWPAASFDVSLAVCVLHHVPPVERNALLADMRRVTRPGGLVVVVEHNPWNPLTRLAVARCPFDHDAVLLSARESRALLRRCGLRAVRSRHILLFPVANAATRRVESWLDGAPLGAQFVAHGTVEG